MEIFQNFIKIFNPIKSVFSLYILMYILPMFIPILIVSSIYESLIVKNILNIPVVVLMFVCGIIAVVWTIYFLTYFTKQRNSNPELYEKGFMSELKVNGGSNE